MASAEGRDLPAWTARQGVEFEVAEDIFGDLIAYCVRQLNAEEQREQPNQDRIAHWQDELARYARERRALDGTDAAAVAGVLETYGPLVRELYHGENAAAE